MRFTKVHGLGNDFILVDARDGAPLPWGDLAQRVCDRHYGVGADGLILLLASGEADFRMRILNNDGSEAQMCGNGIRCLARYVFDRGLTTKTSLAIETLAGVKEIALNLEADRVVSARVNMGPPIFDPARIPARVDGWMIKDHEIAVGGRTYAISCVSMGNPHAVIFLDKDELDALELAEVGPLVEHHPIFPERTNVEFCALVSRNRLRMRVWERGAGNTLACGTGACAAAVQAIIHNYVDPQVELILDGGPLHVEWQGQESPVYMTGGAEYVCDGEYYYEPTS
ncbi:MAG: diaminopimelate epimerase [Chloroflexi bacterium]|nr:diaminopimelate epimerase [Chloroflexota bacterium]